jgi:hypothetical protein
MRTLLASAVVASVVVFLQAQAPPIPRSDNETGMQFYTRYLAAIPKATKIDEVLAFWGADLVKEFNEAPPEERADLDGMKRFYSMVTSVTVVKETSGAPGATLTLEGVGRDGKKITGTAYLIKENGAWKLFDQESWN